MNLCLYSRVWCIVFNYRKKLTNYFHIFKWLQSFCDRCRCKRYRCRYLLLKKRSCLQNSCWAFVFVLSLKMANFQLGDRVFAKVRGYPCWPARIDEIVRVREDIRYINVFFYGTHQVWVSDSPFLHRVLSMFNNTTIYFFLEAKLKLIICFRMKKTRASMENLTFWIGKGSKRLCGKLKTIPI